MKVVKITVPRTSDYLKLYVYRSKNYDDISTIDKVKDMTPVFEITESIAVPTIVNGIECYVLEDKPIETVQPAGIVYNGPLLNIIPTDEYVAEVEMVKLNQYTYLNVLNLNPLPINYNGTMIYYSVIGIDTDNNLITHLSKVAGQLVESDYKEAGTRHIYSCDNYQEDEHNTWSLVGEAIWSENIRIGDKTNRYEFDKYGIPVIETVPIFDSIEVEYSLRPLVQQNFIVLEIPNPWQMNNKKYNFRKMKAFRVCNVETEQYGAFSEPNFQSLMPVSIEKMIILRKDDADNPNIPIEISEIGNPDVQEYNVIRKHGLFYDSYIHKKLGMNRYNIPLEERIAIFSEGSPQDKIKWQMEALPNHQYSFTFYLVDVYGNISSPAHIVITT